MHWPQIIMIAIYGLSLGYSLANDGKPRSGKTSFLSSVFWAAFGLYILYSGGFFQ